MQNLLIRSSLLVRSIKLGNNCIDAHRGELFLEDDPAPLEAAAGDAPPPRAYLLRLAI
jgi:hypothetical protein